VHEFEVLAPELQKQVFDFVAFLRKQQLRQQSLKRTVGKYKDKIRISDDFDAPLGDDFWSGQP
jgi:hypothetical protein